MSGHSHFSTIKRKKEATDKQRGQIFSKLSKMISLAAKDGSDPSMNPRLRIAIDEARSLNMPKDNIERAVKKGSGELGGEKLEEIIYEIVGPGGAAIIVEGITDNKNRTLGDIKKILNNSNCKLANEGSLLWMFERVGYISTNKENGNEKIKEATNEQLELWAIEAGAKDVHQEDGILNIYTEQNELDKIKKNLQELGFTIESAILIWNPKSYIEANEETKKACQRIFEDLDNSDDIQSVYLNIEIN